MVVINGSITNVTDIDACALMISELIEPTCTHTFMHVGEWYIHTFIYDDGMRVVLAENLPYY